jgi:hypothetical protein
MPPATLQIIAFSLYDFKASNFEPISVFLKQGQSLQKIELQGCKFYSESTMLFKSAFQCLASNIQSLTISLGTRFHTPVSTILSEIIVLKPNTSKLTEIRLELGYGDWKEFDLAALLGPLEEDSMLKCLDLGGICTAERVNELFSSIPRLRGLKEIAFLYG